MRKQTEPSGWKDGHRRDGLYVAQTFLGTFFILTNDERPAVSICPACERELDTLQAARRVADYCFPCAD